MSSMLNEILAHDICISLGFTKPSNFFKIGIVINILINKNACSGPLFSLQSISVYECRIHIVSVRNSFSLLILYSLLWNKSTYVYALIIKLGLIYAVITSKLKLSATQHISASPLTF